MELTFLGTGAAFALDRFNAGYVLDRRILIDGGPGVHINLPRAGLELAALEAIIVTHQHGDHTFGLPFVLASRAVRGQGGSFTVVGPPGFTAYLRDLLLLAWGERLFEIVHERLNPTYVEVGPGDDFALAGFDVHVERVEHVPDLPCQGYVFQKDGIRFGFSGDCGECDGLLELVRRSDHFMVEMTGVENDPTHLSRGYVARLVAAHPEVRFFLTHLNSNDPLGGAMLAQDGVTVELVPKA
ncbi:MAG: MBL fold metallo-hydrolase [Candidatus Dormibacteria bacterium]